MFSALQLRPPGSNRSFSPFLNYNKIASAKSFRNYCSLNVNAVGVQVPRQRHITISKSELLDAIGLLFGSQAEINQFRLVSSCVDSILHAEHKNILEEMRADYDLTHSIQNEKTSDEGSVVSDVKDVTTEQNSYSVAENLGFPRFLYKSVKNNSIEESRVVVATRFQRAFIQLLYNAQFEELSAMDLMLTSSLNTDYLLTLPIYIDWKKASESNTIIFRRGYATERQKGYLVVEKLDYLQSELLLGIFSILSKPLGKVGVWLIEAFKSTTIQGQTLDVWTKRIQPWLKTMPFFQRSYSSYDEHMADKVLGIDHLSERVLPIRLAAQRAVTRYEGILSSFGPRGKLIRKLLAWTGFMPTTHRKLPDVDSEITPSEPYLRPICLSRISLSDIWEPATRKFCGNDLWKMLKTAISILLSQSILQEPAFQELILLYTGEMSERNTMDEDEVPALQLKIYERIPIPELPVIFPHKKLSFRILDTIRLDVATILGLLAYFINYKFEDILSSPSAVLLDVIAVGALIIYVIRIALGYKQTWDRYQLLVNRTLYERTVASGFGSVHFLLDASVQQQYKEAILAYAVLLKMENGQVTCAGSVGDKCERFMYNVFIEKVEMPVDKALDTLVRLGLVMEKDVNGKIGVQAVPPPEAREILKQRWSSLLCSEKLVDA